MAQKKKLLIIVLAAVLSFCFLVFAAVCVINAIVIGSAKDNIREISPEDGYETAVVFGAKVHKGGTLSQMLQDRMDTAIALYKSGSVKTLLLSGDGSGEWSEVVYMKKYAVENGVAEEDILLDGEGFSTIETVRRAKDVFGVEKCVLVTQKYHLYRAIYSAEKLGMDVLGASADVRTYAGQFYRDVREVLARVKDFIMSN